MEKKLFDIAFRVNQDPVTTTFFKIEWHSHDEDDHENCSIIKALMITLFDFEMAIGIMRYYD